MRYALILALLVPLTARAQPAGPPAAPPDETRAAAAEDDELDAVTVGLALAAGAATFAIITYTVVDRDDEASLGTAALCGGVCGAAVAGGVCVNAAAPVGQGPPRAREAVATAPAGAGTVAGTAAVVVRELAAAPRGVGLGRPARTLTVSAVDAATGRPLALADPLVPVRSRTVRSSGDIEADTRRALALGRARLTD